MFVFFQSQTLAVVLPVGTIANCVVLFGPHETIYYDSAIFIPAATGPFDGGKMDEWSVMLYMKGSHLRSSGTIRKRCMRTGTIKKRRMRILNGSEV